MKLFETKFTDEIINDKELSGKITELNICQRNQDITPDNIYINDVYLRRNGTEQSDAGSKCTDFILFDEYAVFNVSAVQKFSSPAGICLYDKNKAFLTSFGYTKDSSLVNKQYFLSGDDVFYGNDIVKEYPNAAYIRFSSYRNNLNVSVKTQTTLTQNNIDAEFEKRDEQLIEGVFEDDSSISVINGAWLQGGFTEGVYVKARDAGQYVDFIEIKHGDRYKVSGYSYGTAAIYAIYNEGRQGLYAMFAGSGKHSYVRGLEINCDEILREYPTAKFIMFGTYDSSSLPLEIKKLKKYSTDNFVTTQVGFSEIANIAKYNCYIGKSDGKNSSPFSAIATSLIKIDENSEFIVSLAYMGNACGCACYDENCGFIGSLFKTESGTEYVINEKLTGSQILEAFPNTKYVRFSSLLSNGTFNPKFQMLQPLTLQQVAERQQEIIDTLSASNPLFGKTWLACGDSFTNMKLNDYVDAEGNVGISSDAYDRNYAAYKLYPVIIASANKMKLINAAVGGMPSFLTAYSEEKTAFCEIVGTLSGEISSADYMTLMFGLNDSGTGHIGLSTDVCLSTMWGAWNNILSVVLSCNPAIKIGIISPDGWMNEQFKNAQKAIGKAWGIPVLDLKSEDVPFQSGTRHYDMNPYAVSQRNKVMQLSAINSHPSLLGQRYRSSLIQEFMKSL